MRFDSWARPLYILVIFNFFFQYILRFAYLAPIFELWTFWSWVNHLTISATKAKWFCNSKRARSWCKLYAILKCHSSPSKDTYSAEQCLSEPCSESFRHNVFFLNSQSSCQWYGSHWRGSSDFRQIWSMWSAYIPKKPHQVKNDICYQIWPPGGAPIFYYIEIEVAI